MSDTNTPPSARTFYRIEGDPPQCVGVEMEQAHPGTPCGYTHLTEPAWGKFEDETRVRFGRPGFVCYAEDEQALAANGYASSPDGAWELALDKARLEADLAFSALHLANAKWRTLRIARQVDREARKAAKEGED